VKINYALFPFSAALLKLHLNHTAILTPNPTHLQNRYALVRRVFFALVASIRELKTAMLTLYFERLKAFRLSNNHERL